MTNLNLKNLNAETNKNEIIMEINEGRKQLCNYWIAEIEEFDNNFKFYKMSKFLKAKEFGYTKIFKLEENKTYVIQTGKSTKNDVSKRNFVKFENDEIVLIK